MTNVGCFGLKIFLSSFKMSLLSTNRKCSIYHKNFGSCYLYVYTTISMCILQSLYYNLYTTISILQSLYYNLYTTISILQSLYYNLYVYTTISMCILQSLCVNYNLYVYTTISMVLVPRLIFNRCFKARPALKASKLKPFLKLITWHMSTQMMNYPF